MPLSGGGGGGGGEAGITLAPQALSLNLRSGVGRGWVPGWEDVVSPVTLGSWDPFLFANDAQSGSSPGSHHRVEGWALRQLCCVVLGK